MFDELVDEVTRRIEATEGRERSRRQTDQQCFEHSVKVTLADLWKSVRSIPLAECSINKRSGYYSEVPIRYRDPLLTYRQHIAVHEGLLKLGFIEITQNGFFDRETLQGDLTRYIAKDELLERLIELDGHPAITFKPVLNAETIILRNKVDGKKRDVDYVDTPSTDRYRDNLKKINKCFLRHWVDLDIKDKDIQAFEAAVGKKNKQSLDFSKRTLVRIFSNGSFKEGGRFYRVWWQNIPSEYRKFISIDRKRTAEVDFSQMSPHLLYIANYKELGSEDAYDRVLDGEHRDKVKAAFNAMVQASSVLKSCPNDIDMSTLEMSWADLRDKILSAHKPISDQFFKGVGNKLQFKDSCIAERIMLNFAEMDAPSLPVHDSFICHHGYAETGEMEEIMRKAFFEEMNEHISKVDKEILSWSYYKEDDTLENPSVEQVLNALDEFSQWEQRHILWDESKRQ
ncbi:hypothetical protein N9S42_00570 [Paracoccaceae bacterium]|jgi:hypothetical protein|nr:hypothetical protein [Paracoccaceae bacterium]